MDKMIITQTFTMAKMANFVKKSEATKQTKDQNNDKTKTKTKQNKTKQAKVLFLLSELLITYCSVLEGKKQQQVSP